MARSASPSFRGAWDAVADAAGVSDATSVLDLGCGRGAFCSFAARRGAIVHGIDAEPDAIAQALRDVPGGDFRLGMMESLPWPSDSFDVVTGFNAVQYALDPDLALAEAGRVVRSSGRIGICKWGTPAENEFFAFLTSIGANGICGHELPGVDPVEDAIGASRLEVVDTGEVPAPIEIVDDDALAASLSRAGVFAERIAVGAVTSVAVAAAPYRQADGTYRFENRLRFWVLRRAR